MIVAPKSCIECPLTERDNPKYMIRQAFKMLDAAQQLFSQAIGATTAKDPEILEIINDVDMFNMYITRLRELRLTYANFEQKHSGFDRILDDIEDLTP